MTQEKYIKIARCSNPILWYNAKIGNTYQVAATQDAFDEEHSTRAFWVHTEDGMLAWVYKEDAFEIIPVKQ